MRFIQYISMDISRNIDKISSPPFKKRDGWNPIHSSSSEWNTITSIYRGEFVAELCHVWQNILQRKLAKGEQFWKGAIYNHEMQSTLDYQPLFLDHKNRVYGTLGRSTQPKPVAH